MTVSKLPTIGLVGVGQMGLAIAKRLIDAGYTVHGYRRGSLAEFVNIGGVPAASPAEIAREVDVIISSLPNFQAFKSVLYGENGIVDNRRKELIIIETSTFPALDKIQVHEALKAREIHLLDCPILGTPEMMAADSASVYCSGSAEYYAHVEPVIQTLSPTTPFVGAVGAGSSVKQISNALVAIHTLAAAEAVTMAELLGLDSGCVLKAITASGASSKMLEIRGETMSKRMFHREGGGVRYYGWMLSQIEEEIGKDACLPLLSSTAATFREAARGEHAECSPEAIITTLLN